MKKESNCLSLCFLQSKILCHRGLHNRNVYDENNTKDNLM